MFQHKKQPHTVMQEIGVGGGTLSQVENKQQNGKSKSLFISDCFTCKWVKLSNQNTETGRLNKNS